MYYNIEISKFLTRWVTVEHSLDRHPGEESLAEFHEGIGLSIELIHDDSFRDVLQYV